MPIFVLLLYVTLQYKSGSLLLYMCTFMTCCCFPPISRTIIRLNQVKFCWMLHVLAWVFFPRYTYAQESIFCFFPLKTEATGGSLCFFCTYYRELTYVGIGGGRIWNNLRRYKMNFLMQLQCEALPLIFLIFTFLVSVLGHETSGAKSMAVKFMKFQTSLL